MNTFPRAEIPGADPAQVEALQTVLREADAAESHTRAQQRAMAQAMLRLGKPIFRAGKPKRRKVTKHVRQMRRNAARKAAA